MATRAQSDMKVSAIMVTGNRPERRAFIAAAIRCFRQQTFPERELIIINDGPPITPLPPVPEIREFHIPFSAAATLGELRNLGLKIATGTHVIQWDDDDWHHPERIRVQAEAWVTGSMVLLTAQLRYNTVRRELRVYEHPRGIHGTILHQRLPHLQYPNLRKAEDSHFLAQFNHGRLVPGRPELYLRFYHGANTWDEDHVMGYDRAATAPFVRPPSADEQDFATRILTAAYPDLADSSGPRQSPSFPDPSLPQINNHH